MKIWKLKNEIYHIETWFILGKDINKIRVYLTNKYNADFSDTINSDGCCFWSENKVIGIKDYYIWLPVFDRKQCQNWVALVHELWHLTGMHLRDAGVKEDPGGEAGAYYYDYMFEQIFDKLMSHKRGK